MFDQMRSLWLLCGESTAGGGGWEQKAGTVTKVEGKGESWNEGRGEALVMGVAGERRSLAVAQRGGRKQGHSQASAPTPHIHTCGSQAR